MDTEHQSEVTRATFAEHKRTTLVIYLMVCSVNDKRYVGQTKQTLWCRWLEHRNAGLGAPDQTYKQRTALARAMRRYGPSAFDLTVLQVCATASELDDAEAHWITKLETRAPAGYNLTGGGKSSLRVAEVGAAISTSNRGRTKTPEWRAKLRAAHLGKVLSAETRRKISEVQRGRKQSPESRAKRSVSMMGKNSRPCSFETRAKISAALMGKPLSEETKAKLAIAIRGKKRSEETRQRMSKSAFAREARKRAAHR